MAGGECLLQLVTDTRAAIDTVGLPPPHLSPRSKSATTSATCKTACLLWQVAALLRESPAALLCESASCGPCQATRELLRA